MTLDEYWTKVRATATAYPSLRYGQAAFNVLYAVRPDLSEPIRGTMLDPFHSRGDLAAFSAYLVGNWDKENNG